MIGISTRLNLDENNFLVELEAVYDLHTIEIYVWGLEIWLSSWEHLAALPEDPGSIPGTCMAAQTCL